MIDGQHVKAAVTRTLSSSSAVKLIDSYWCDSLPISLPPLRISDTSFPKVLVRVAMVPYSSGEAMPGLWLVLFAESIYWFLVALSAETQRILSHRFS